jgi:hypothetical protein
MRTNLQHLLLAHSGQLISITVELLAFDIWNRILSPVSESVVLERLEINLLLHLEYPSIKKMYLLGDSGADK